MLKATWSFGEPNMHSAIKKNKKGLCAFHECSNRLSNSPSYAPPGVKICDACGKSLDEMCRKTLEEVGEDTDRKIIAILERRCNEQVN